MIFLGAATTKTPGSSWGGFKQIYSVDSAAKKNRVIGLNTMKDPAAQNKFALTWMVSFATEITKLGAGPAVEPSRS